MHQSLPFLGSAPPSISEAKVEIVKCLQQCSKEYPHVVAKKRPDSVRACKFGFVRNEGQIEYLCIKRSALESRLKPNVKKRLELVLKMLADDNV